MSDYQALRDEVDTLKRSVQSLEQGERFTMLEKIIDANTQAVQEFTESSRFQLSEQNRRIESLEVKLSEELRRMDDKIDALDVKLNGKIDALEAKLDGKIDALEAKLDAKIERFRTDLENKIAHSQTVILSAIAAVGVILAAIQIITA